MLLEELAKISGVSYLSDLPTALTDDQLNSVVGGIRQGAFSLKEWEDAVRYLYRDSTLSFPSEEAIREYIKNHRR